MSTTTKPAQQVKPNNQKGNPTPQGKPNNQKENPTPQGKQKGNNPPQKPVDLKLLFNLFIIKERLINGLYITKENKDYATIATDYKKPFIKIIDVFDKYYRQPGVCLVNAEIPNFKSSKKFNENEISQFFNSDTYVLDKNTNNWSIEIVINFNENLKKYNELKNVKDLKITYLTKEIPGINLTQKNMSESHLNFKNYCETSYPPKEFISIYSNFAEDINNFIDSEKSKPDVNIVYDFKKIVDNFPKIIDKITLNVESVPSPYTILQHIHNKDVNSCDIKAINNILQKLFIFDANDTSKIKDLKFNYYNNIHFGVLVALLLYYKNYTGDVMTYKLFNEDRSNNGSKKVHVGRDEKIYDPVFKMKTFDISKILDLLKDTNDIIDQDETENEYNTPKYNKSFKYYIALLQYNTEILKKTDKSYFKGNLEDNPKLTVNFQITYDPTTIKSYEFGFIMSLLTIGIDDHKKFYNSKTDFIKDIQFFMKNGIKHESCSAYLLNNATQGLNSLIETSQNTISNISEKAGGIIQGFSPEIKNYSDNFTTSMHIIANSLNGQNERVQFVLNDNTTRNIDFEYTEERFKINTVSLGLEVIQNNNSIKVDINKPIFFQVEILKDDEVIIDDNLNEYIIKNIFNTHHIKAVISCNKDSTLLQQNDINKQSDNLFDCMYYALGMKNYFEQTQNEDDVNIKKKTIQHLRNIISENIGNYELNSYLNNRKSNNNEFPGTTKFINDAILHFPRKHTRPQIPNTGPVKDFSKDIKFDANEDFDNKFFYKLLYSFKKFVITEKYWGDNYAIQIFEKHYGIKIILFDLDYDRIVCNTQILYVSTRLPEQTPKENPDTTTGKKYLFMSYYRSTDNNYIYNTIQFVSTKLQNNTSPNYEEKYIYDYNEIPNDIIQSIIKNCATNVDEPYSYYFNKFSKNNQPATETINRREKVTGGVTPEEEGHLPYGPFFINKDIDYPICDNFNDFMYKRFQQRKSQGISPAPAISAPADAPAISAPADAPAISAPATSAPAPADVPADAPAISAPATFAAAPADAISAPAPAPTPADAQEVVVVSNQIIKSIVNRLKPTK